jgi:bHLH factor
MLMSAVVQKNVEKKRRETINDGIKRLSDLVPGADKNKSKIINQAAHYIEALKRNETSNLEKWTLDKLMTERTIRDLQTENEELRRAVEKRDRQLEELGRMMDGVTGKRS